MKKLERKQVVYDLMTWAYDLDRYCPAESALVPNLFLPGKRCEVIQGEIFDMVTRVEERLGGHDDEDLERIEILYNEMMEIVGLEMYECGRRFAHWRNGRRRVLVGAVRDVRPRRARSRLSQKNS